MSKPTLKGKVFLITGASSGIGRALALVLANAGASLTLAGRNSTRLEEVTQDARSLGGMAHSVITDVSDRSQVEWLVQETIAKWGTLNVLISNAGEYIRAPIMDLNFADLERSMAVNFYGHVYAVQAVLPVMIHQGDGHIFLMSTMDAKKGIPPDAPYVSAKCALSGFGEVLRQELQQKGIGVTTVFPGRVNPPMISGLLMPWISAKIAPETVAQAILRAIKTRPAEIILPPQAVLLYLVNILSPLLADWFARTLKLEGRKAINELPKSD